MDKLRGALSPTTQSTRPKTRPRFWSVGINQALLAGYRYPLAAKSKIIGYI
jgi:hypothetical protein